MLKVDAKDNSINNLPAVLNYKLCSQFQLARQTSGNETTKEYIGNKLRAMRSEGHDKDDEKMRRIFDMTLKTETDKLKLIKKAEEKITRGN